MKLIFIFYVVFLSTLTTIGQSNKNTTSNKNSETYIGPENGYLVLAGTTWESSGLLKTFVSLAGTNPTVIIIPTGLWEENEILNENDTFLIEIKKAFKNAGAGEVHFLHTNDPSIANSPAFFSKIKEAKAVWFTGGNTSKITNAYLHTKISEELQNLLDRGGVIGGNSAGAAVLATYYMKADTSTTESVFEENTNGFDFIKNACIIPHLLANNNQFKYFDFKKGHNSDLLGIGIDHTSFAIIHKNELQVRGGSYVAIYDGTFQSNRRKNSFDILPENSERFYVLYGSAKYDLLKRKVIQFFGQ